MSIVTIVIQVAPLSWIISMVLPGPFDCYYFSSFFLGNQWSSQNINRILLKNLGTYWLFELYLAFVLSPNLGLKAVHTLALVYPSPLSFTVIFSPVPHYILATLEFSQNLGSMNSRPLLMLLSFSPLFFPSFPFPSFSSSPLPSLPSPQCFLLFYFYLTFTSLFLCNFLRETLLLEQNQAQLLSFLMEELFYDFLLVVYVTFQNYRIMCVFSFPSVASSYRVGTWQSCSLLYCQQLAHCPAHTDLNNAG